MDKSKDASESLFSGWIVKGFYYSVLVNTGCKVLTVVPYCLFSWHFKFFISLERTSLFLILVFSFFVSVYNAFSKYLGRYVLDLLVVFCLFFLPLFETYKSIVPLSNFDLFDYMSADWLQLHQKSSSLWKVDLLLTLIQVGVVLGVLVNLCNAGVVARQNLLFRYVRSERKASLPRGVMRVVSLVWMTLLVSLFSTLFFISGFLGGVTNNTLEIRNTSTLVSIMQKYQRTVSPGKVQKVILIPMVHVGQPQFYKGIVDYVDRDVQKWIFLEEGVRDKDKVFGLEIQHGYSSLAKRLHLEEQAKNFINIVKSKYRVINADVSATQFSKETKDVLGSIFSMMSQSGNLMNFFTYSQKVKIEEHEIKAMGKDILHLRNDRVIAVVERELKNNFFLVIPWGAAHIPAFQKYLEKSGFVESNQEFIQVMDFSEVALRYFGLM